jgi:hypothetical protein
MRTNIRPVRCDEDPAAPEGHSPREPGPDPVSPWFIGGRARDENDPMLGLPATKIDLTRVIRRRRLR